MSTMLCGMLCSLVLSVDVDDALRNAVQSSSPLMSTMLFCGMLCSLVLSIVSSPLMSTMLFCGMLCSLVLSIDVDNALWNAVRCYNSDVENALFTSFHLGAK